MPRAKGQGHVIGQDEYGDLLSGRGCRVIGGAVHSVSRTAPRQYMHGGMNADRPGAHVGLDIHILSRSGSVALHEGALGSCNVVD
ncbi:MAG TPA: hypothetical protein VNS79_09025 [Sphingobium sp.]|nr:hypothetical protein [Sphingobium sp.]